MKKSFQSRLEAIDWIAANAKDEAQFEVLREQLNFNYIYYQIYFVDLTDTDKEIVMLNNAKRPR